MTVGRKIAFVAPHAYPLLSDPGPGASGGATYGGADVQLVEVGRSLERTGWEVTYITLAPEVPGWRPGPSVRILTTCRWSDGVPGLRYLHPRTTGLWRALRRAGASVYISRTASGQAGIIALFCRLAGARYVFSNGCDAHVDSRYRADLNGRDRFLYRLALRWASAIIVQTEHQKSLLRSSFGLEGRLIPNGCECPSRLEVREPRYFLWAGTIRPEKNPLKYLEMARMLPERRFVMLGGPGDPELHARIVREAESLPNLEFLGHRDRKGTLDAYFEAIALVNTSEYEGFANTYLEAWSRAVPVLTLNGDPDEVICRKGLGFHKDRLEALVERAEWLASHAESRALMGESARRHVQETHQMGVVNHKWIELFHELAAARPMSA